MCPFHKTLAIKRSEVMADGLGGDAKCSLYTLIDHLRPSDTIGIVVYAGEDRVVLTPTEVRDESKIKQAIESLSSGGSTNADAGIVRAYQLAEQAREKQQATDARENQKEKQNAQDKGQWK